MKKKYGFGYLVLTIALVLGWLILVLAASLLVSLGSIDNSNLTMNFFGAALAAQGVLFIVSSQLGIATLDAANNSSSLLINAASILDEIKKPKPPVSEELMRIQIATSAGALGMRFVELYKDKMIFESEFRGYCTGGNFYPNLISAKTGVERELERELRALGFEISDKVALIFAGYLLPYKGGKFIVPDGEQNRLVKEPEAALDFLIKEILLGNSQSLSKFRLSASS
ncbi:MAG: hypothetical protein NTX73_01730 [Rhodobacterales bacterium]|nr:hypothetical protein [Rhodobacterales bacterium]